MKKKIMTWDDYLNHWIEHWKSSLNIIKWRLVYKLGCEFFRENWHSICKLKILLIFLQAISLYFCYEDKYMYIIKLYFWNTGIFLQTKPISLRNLCCNFHCNFTWNTFTVNLTRYTIQSFYYFLCVETYRKYHYTIMYV